MRAPNGFALSKLATIGATFAVLGPIALATAPGALATTGCKTGVLPVTVIGAPGLKPQQALGVYLWHNGSGYSLRATKVGKERVQISGTVTVSRTLHNIKRVRLEKNDSVTIGPKRHTATFKFNNYGYIDGFDFAAACSEKVTVVVKVGTVQATPAQVFLGKNRTNPTSVPFTIERAPTAAAAKVS